MIVIEKVQHNDVSQILEKHNSNIRFQNYDLPSHCPEGEFECYKVLFEREDIERLYLVGNFSRVTRGTCKLKELDSRLALEQEEEDRGLRIKRLIDGGEQFQKGVNLIEDPGFEIVLFGRDLKTGALLIIDGSHRAIAHYIKNVSIENVPAYICIHKNITQYSFYKFIGNI